jgi:hypothetical protein
MGENEPRRVHPASDGIPRQGAAEAEWDRQLQSALTRSESNFCFRYFCGPPGPDTWGRQIHTVLRINELTELSPGEKLFVKECFSHYVGTYSECVRLHKRTLSLEICFGIASGLVPILIPFSQTYKDDNWQIFGGSINIGGAISIIATLCSLIGAIVHVYLKASHISVKAAACTIEAGKIEDALNHFLARAGPDFHGVSDDREAFRIFAAKYQEIRNDAYDSFVKVLKKGASSSDDKNASDGHEEGKKLALPAQPRQTLAQRCENVKDGVADELAQRGENVVSAVTDTTARAEERLGNVEDGLSQRQSDRRDAFLA